MTEEQKFFSDLLRLYTPNRGTYYTPEDVIKIVSVAVKLQLKAYTDFLLEAQYCDSDVYSEEPTAIDRFMNPELR
jgi:hypothetical protein